MASATTTLQVEGYCPYCSNPPYGYVYHSGACPKIKACEEIEGLVEKYISLAYWYEGQKNVVKSLTKGLIKKLSAKGVVIKGHEHPRYCGYYTVGPLREEK